MTAMRLLVVNPNTSTEVTERLARVASSAAAATTEVEAVQPDWGVVSVEGYYDGYVSVAASLAAVHRRLDAGQRWDATIWAGFGDPGREALQELLPGPVVGITEAAAHTACLVGHRYAVITTRFRSIPMIEDLLAVSGLASRCCGVFAAGLPVLAAERDLVDRIAELRGVAVGAGADVLCLGSAAMAGLAPALSKALGLPVVDGVASAVQLAESVVRLGLTTSRVNGYAQPLPKHRPGWPR